jgi:hypothetical protein
VSKGSPHISVRVPPALLARIEAQAARKQVTVTSLVVNALLYWTADAPTPAGATDERLERRKRGGHQ